MLGWLFVQGVVEDVVDITPRMRKITVTGPEIGALSWTPGQQVRVRLPGGASGARGLGTLRTYSVWTLGEGRLELCVLDHGDGPGSRWVRCVKASDEVQFRRPEGRLVTVGSAPYHLFAGEETASVAFGPMLAGLPGSAAVYGVIEVDGAQDRLPLPRADELTWRYRDGGDAASSIGLVAAVRELDLPAEPGVAYLAGELRTCQEVRTHLVRDRGWPRRSVVLKPFWMPGRRGMD
jgi:NADPH-dependent ferric siderophore reductase